MKVLLDNDFLHVERSSASTLVMQWKNDAWVNEYMRYVLSEHTDLDIGLARFMVDYRAMRGDEDAYNHKLTFSGVVMQPLTEWTRERKNRLRYDELAQCMQDISEFMLMVQVNSEKSLPYIPHEHIFVMEYTHMEADDEGRLVSRRVTRFVPLFLSPDIQWCSLLADTGDIPCAEVGRHTMIAQPALRLPKKYVTSPEMVLHTKGGGDDSPSQISCASWVYALGLLCVYLHKNNRRVFTQPEGVFLTDIDDIADTPLYHTLVRCLDRNPLVRSLI
jgi:hypothetical protein